MFELSIKCSKDIDELHINFSDGSSVVTTKPEPPKDPKPPRKSKDKKIENPPVFNDIPLDLDADHTHSSAIIEKPEIELIDREPNVSDVMQNMEI